MCGISGKFRFDGKPVLQEEILAMNQAMVHRGPDDEGIFVEGPIGLGHRRLAILDLSPAGHQPMTDSSERFVITFNGEIYNFLELRQELEKKGIRFRSRTDTEVILELYKLSGLHCLEKLRGMFAFAIWDRQHRNLFLARDRCGKKPLKYYSDGKIFIFASELKALWKDPNTPKIIDWEAVDEFLCFGYVPSPKTGFKNFWKLPPAHYLIVRSTGEIVQRQYWNLERFFEKSGSLCHPDRLELGIGGGGVEGSRISTISKDTSEDEWENLVQKKLEESVRLRMISDVPIGAMLSGGIDSSMVVALMAEQSQKPVKTFSVGFEEQGFNELPFAKMVAECYGTDHQELIVKAPDLKELLPTVVRHFEEPFADPSMLPTWLVCELTEKHVKVALTGDGGDENFAGYERYRALPWLRILPSLPGKNFLKKLFQLGFQITHLRQFHQLFRLFSCLDQSSPGSYHRLMSVFSPEEKKALTGRETTFGAVSPSLDLDDILKLDFETYLPDDLLVKGDQASMAHSLELRSPFLDHELLELTAQMPVSYKMRGWNQKILLKRIAQKYLPQELLSRKKQGFRLPLHSWFRGPLLRQIQEELLEGPLISTGFQKKVLENMMSDHLAFRRNLGHQLFSLLVLSLWLKQCNN